MSGITEGSWPANITSWDMRQTKNGAWVLDVWLKCWGEDWTKNVKWSGFFLKNDGTRNENTYKTLRVCGFAGDDLAGLAEDDALDTETEFNVTVVQDGEYWNVEWINEGGWQAGAMVDKQTLAGHDLSKLNSMLGPAKPKTAPPPMDSSEDIDEFLNP